MTDTVALVKQLVDKIETELESIEDLEPVVVKYRFDFASIEKDKYYIGIMPTRITADVVSSRSSYPVIGMSLVIAHTIADKNITKGNEDLIEVINKIYDKFHQNGLGGLVSDATASVDFEREILELNSLVAYAFVEIEFKKFRSEVNN